MNGNGYYIVMEISNDLYFHIYLVAEPWRGIWWYYEIANGGLSDRTVCQTGNWVHVQPGTQCEFSCNLTVNGTDKDLADSAAWQPRESRGPQNLQILKYVAASFGLDSILLSDVAVLEPCQQHTEITSLITAANTPTPLPERLLKPLVTVLYDTGIYVSSNNVVRSRNVYTSSVVLTVLHHSLEECVFIAIWCRR